MPARAAASRPDGDGNCRPGRASPTAWPPRDDWRREVNSARRGPSAPRPLPRAAPMRAPALPPAPPVSPPQPPESPSAAAGANNTGAGRGRPGGGDTRDGRAGSPRPPSPSRSLPPASAVPALLPALPSTSPCPLPFPSGPQTGRAAAAARRWPGVLREAEGASPGHCASRSATQDETKPRCAPSARHPTDPPNRRGDGGDTAGRGEAAAGPRPPHPPRLLPLGLLPPPPGHWSPPPPPGRSARSSLPARRRGRRHRQSPQRLSNRAGYLYSPPPSGPPQPASCALESRPLLRAQLRPNPPAQVETLATRPAPRPRGFPTPPTSRAALRCGRGTSAWGRRARACTCSPAGTTRAPLGPLSGLRCHPSSPSNSGIPSQDLEGPLCTRRLRVREVRDCKIKLLSARVFRVPARLPGSVDGGGAGGQKRAARPARPLTHVAPRPARFAAPGAARSASQLVHPGPRPVPRNYHRPTARQRGGWCPRWPAGGRPSAQLRSAAGGPRSGGSRGAATARPSLCRS